ncbi:MAG: 50S ribosomal protein L18 [Candidatus Micrarchaeota archaeon]|nr:50S ribosomal protein L18 [Candidatus Micrarchaeota archaeon]
MHKVIRHRRKSARTNYRKRIASLKGGMDRVVVRKSNKAISMQVVEYSISGDKVVASANSRELKAIGWEPRCNTPTAYLTGMLLAKKVGARKDRIPDFVLDIGLYRPVKGSVIFAAAKGFKDSDAGLNLHANIEFDSGRLSGKHISDYAGSLKEEKYKERFSSYAKSGFDAKDITKKFESVKKELASK